MSPLPSRDVGRAPWSRPAWAVYGALGLAATAGYFLLPSAAVRAAALTCFVLAAVLVGLLGLRWHRPRPRTPWLLIAASGGCVVAGNVVATFAALFRTGPAPVPSPAEPFYLAAYPAIAAAVILLARGAARGDHAGAIDAAIGTLGLGVAVWAFAMAPYADNDALSPVARLVALAYPLLDLLLLGLVLRLFLAPGRRSVARFAVVAAVALTCCGDIGAGLLTLAGTYRLGHPIDAAWPLAYTCWGVAALHPSMAALGAPQHPGTPAALTRGRLALLIAAALIGPATFLILTARGAHIDTGLVVAATLALFLLALLRVGVMTRDLREREQRFAALLQHAGDMITVLDAGGAVTYQSPAAARVFGLDPAAGGAAAWTGLVHPDDLPRMRAAFAELLAAPGGRRALALRARHADGSYLDLEVTGENLLAVPGVAGLVVTARDVTARDRAAAALAASEARFRALVQHATDVVTVVDAGGTIAYQSPAAARVLGVDGAALTGRAVFAFIERADRARARQFFARLLADPAAVVVETLRVRHRDGGWRTVEVTGTNLLAEPAVHGIVTNLRDVTERAAAAAALRHAAESFASTFNAAGEALLIRDDRAVLAANDAYAALVGRPIAALVGAPFVGLLAPASAADAWARVRAGDERPFEGAVVRADGVTVPVEVAGKAIRFEGRPARLVALRDISERHAAAAALHASEARLAEAQRIAHVGSWEFDYATGALTCSDEIFRIGGHAPRAVAPTLAWLREGIHPDDRGWVGSAFQKALESGVPYGVDFRVVRPDGEVRVVHQRAELVRDAAGRPAKQVGVMQDVTAQRALEARIAHQAFHDALTGLPNRALFQDRLDHAVARAARAHAPLAVLFLDLDRFKQINDTLGHATGDQLLVAVAARLARSIRAGDTVARLGGDEFTILLEPLDDAAEAITTAERVLEAFGRPFQAGAHQLTVATSVGVVLGRAGLDSPADLLRYADVALYEAKAAGRGRYAVFDTAMSAAALERAALEGDLPRALERDELVLHYQPKVDLASGRLVGLEALVRWRHPTRGLLPPDRFIPLAEESGLIVPLGQWVLAAACAQIRDWRARYGAAVPVVSVNLAAGQLRQPDLVAMVARLLAAAGVPPARLQLELTESALMRDPAAAAATLAALRALGVGLALDDFGTGYSSLGYLKRFPIDTVKLDKTFVDALGRDAEDTAIVAAVLGLGRTLGFGVVAEGIESAAQADRLRALGCATGQGYHFARPLPADQAEDLVAAAASPLAGTIV